MLGNDKIPLRQQIEWVWQQTARLHPEFERGPWLGHEDPYMIHEIVNNNVCRFQGFSGARVMDIGANVGVFTILCALNGARVTAYEPNREAYRVLCEQLRRTGTVGLVTAANRPVWTRTGPVQFQQAKGYFARATWDFYNGLVLTGAENEKRNFAATEVLIEENAVEAISFDDAVGGGAWDCVKMDIEGGEFYVLLAASDEALGRVKFLTVELHPQWADRALYESLIAKLERTFTLEGVREGDPRFADENRWVSIYATRRDIRQAVSADETAKPLPLDGAAI